MAPKGSQEQQAAMMASAGSTDVNTISATTIMSSSTTDSSLFDEWSSKFSVDLVRNAHLHKLFLEKLHTLGVTLKRPSRESLRRYTDLWLPLVMHHESNPQGTTKLIPPLDVGWLWHCHRLAPRDYHKYMKDTFGPNVCLEANPPFTFQQDHATAADTDVLSSSGVAVSTRALWNERYGMSEPFFLQEQDGAEQNEEEVAGGPVLLSGFDLLGSTERQATFLWQVSGPCFDDEDFLMEGVINYGRFLTLKPKCTKPRTVLVPTYQIDLIWHTHILSSLTKYDQDCIGILGQSFHHDDSLNDRSEGGILETSYHATRDLWKQIYGIEYVVEGGMYRGEPPAAYFHEQGGTWVAAREYETTHHAVRKVLEMGGSSTSTSNYVIADTVKWHYWVDSSKTWQKYDAAACDKMETFRLQTATKSKWNLTSGAHTYEVDVVQMTQRNTRSGKVRPIRRIQVGELYDLTTPPDTRSEQPLTTNSSGRTGPADWHYWLDRAMDGKSGGWHVHDADIGAKIEASYQDYKAGRDTIGEQKIRVGKYSYEFDFKTMTQRKTTSNRLCQIRRALQGDTSLDMVTGPPEAYQWVEMDGKTSVGRDAFILVTNIQKRRDLKVQPFREGYVLGRAGGRTGYFSLETRESHEIILKRLRVAIGTKNSQIAQAKSCCGAPDQIPKLEKEVEGITCIYNEVYKRSKAKDRRGPEIPLPRSTNPKDATVQSNWFAHDTGVWLYPPFVWDNCGGACGGTTACGPSSCGGGACAACGGGGCGGGGCGGGGGG